MSDLGDIFRDAIDEVQKWMGPIKPKAMLHKCAEAYALGHAQGLIFAREVEDLRLQKALAECPEP